MRQRGQLPPSNTHNSVTFDDVYGRVMQICPEIEVIAADSAYNISHICKEACIEFMAKE